MRFATAIICACLLGGCAADPWPSATDWIGSADETPTPAPVERTAAAVSCDRFARERESDVQTQGFDTDLQQKAYAQTYQSCMRYADHGIP